MFLAFGGDWPAVWSRWNLPSKTPSDGIWRTWPAQNWALPVLQEKQQILCFFTHSKYIEYGFGYLQRLNMLCICRVYNSIYLYAHIHELYMYTNPRTESFREISDLGKILFWKLHLCISGKSISSQEQWELAHERNPTSKYHVYALIRSLKCFLQTI